MLKTKGTSRGKLNGAPMGIVFAISLLFLLVQLALRLFHVQRLSFAEDGGWDAVSLLPRGLNDIAQNMALYEDSTSNANWTITGAWLIPSGLHKNWAYVVSLESCGTERASTNLYVRVGSK